ncbi:IS630 family transposase [Paraflavisolibacter sp. H34]|uniref:IS630 family transposase n=1 Tax=Huijunlia imazamoxiresistens TaxID=3127457 RepID=UPI00301803DF
MPALQFNIRPADIEKLSYERYAYPQPMVQKRIFSVYLKAVSSYSNQEIGFITGLHANTVAHWIKVYEDEGYKGLLSNNYGTNQSELESKSSSILSCFSEQPPHSAREAADRIKELTGIERSEQQVRSFMSRHGLKFIKCGHVPAKADNEQQHSWMEQHLQPAIEEARKGKIHLLFLDAAHFMLQPFLCCLWCVARIFIKAASGRNRINVLGVVHAISKKVVTLTNTTYITADTLVQFLKQLKSHFRGKPIYIVLDNARYQRCQLVMAAAKSLGITLLFLPPYSPNLNIIERLWKFAKKKILYARYYEKPAAFHQAIESFFKDINQNFKKELKTLMPLKFQFFDNQNSLIYPL